MTDAEFTLVRRAVANGTIPHGEVNAAVGAMVEEVERLRAEVARLERIEELSDALLRARAGDWSGVEREMVQAENRP